MPAESKAKSITILVENADGGDDPKPPRRPPVITETVAYRAMPPLQSFLKSISKKGTLSVKNQLTTKGKKTQVIKITFKKNVKKKK